MSARAPALEAVGLSKVYRRGSEEIAAVRDVSLRIEKGELVAFTGPSGSGKTTLVHLLGCLDNPTRGQLSLGDRPIFRDDGRRLSERRLTEIRRDAFGYVFQSFYLIPTLTVLENVVLPLTFYRKPGAGKDAAELLGLLGLDHRRNHLPGTLSGGEMQRVAIARALINEPQILLADEPTGNLDTKRSAEIVRILKDLSRNAGVTVIMVSHNLELAGQADRLFEMRDGAISEWGDRRRGREGPLAAVQP
ncbi:MAG: ABC transporter ATP-binding protein [Deferrisomatales bacterium]